MGRMLPAGIILPFAVFWQTFDRSLVLPLVPVVAREFGTSIAAAGSAITLHALAYAILPLLWGPLSTRWGRVRVLTVSTAIGAIASLASAVAPDIVTFVIARALAGIAFAATFPAVLVYFGDTVPLGRRSAAMSNLATAAALGIASGVLGAGAMAEWTSWRFIFGGFAVVAALLVPALATLPPAGDHRGERVRLQLASLVRNRWALWLYTLTALEGFLLIGVFNLLPVVLQQTGEGVFVSGLVTASFGVAVVVVSQLMKLVVGRTPAWLLMLAAGVTAVAAFAVMVAGVSLLAVLIGATFIGVAWALGHTTLQTWMTDAAADARALGMTFFAISLMAGASLGAAAGTMAADQHAFGSLFAISLAGAVVFGVAGTLSRARYRPAAERIPW
ncbi:MFS transporter [Cryobacterium sp. BB736]|uniref:MFS transporter n=1 Tax=Cryobacterium sp. BB736 TaxID=2746963 RepID=UPI0018734020|nr:MFS transporter [Cryobacterium sp. BB736]